MEIAGRFPHDEKSRELVTMLLRHTNAPFSRAQFTPGHITCTGLVRHPSRDAFLLVHHHRLNRWLLPGGHVEPEDAEIWDAARREVVEETGATLEKSSPPELIGIDVHGIPAGKGEPYHLHHDLIWALRASSDVIVTTEEARQVAWCTLAETDRYSLPSNVLRSAQRAF